MGDKNRERIIELLKQFGVDVRCLELNSSEAAKLIDEYTTKLIAISQGDEVVRIPDTRADDLIKNSQEFKALISADMEKLDKIYSTALQNADKAEYGDPKIKEMVFNGITFWYENEKYQIESTAINLIISKGDEDILGKNKS